MWYNYTMNTFDQSADKPIAVQGIIEAKDENEAMEKVKGLYTGVEIGYEFLELIERDNYYYPSFTRNCLNPNMPRKDWRF